MSHSLGNPGYEGITFLGVREVLTVEDLELPILFDKSNDDDSIVGKRIPEGGGGRK